jgi:hypothetical protein
MKFTIDLDEDQVLELLKRHVEEKEVEDSINSLSIIFQRHEEADGEPVYQPALFFCPNWDFDFEVSVALTDAFQEYLDDENNDDDANRDLMTRLLETTNAWIKEQREGATTK